MLCDKCQNNKASVHLTRIINGEKEEIHLCDQCARENSQISSNKYPGFQSLLSGILNQNYSDEENLFFNNEENKIICFNCNLTYREFAENGFFGCSECFKFFADKLDKLFKRIHGHNRHNGKIPVSFKKIIEAESEIDNLKKDMKAAVEKENFEKAAEIRDKINIINKDIKEDNNG